MTKFKSFVPIVVAMIGGCSVANATSYDFTAIDVPGSRSTLAWDINDYGQLVGGYTDATGEHGFVLSGGAYSAVNYPGALFITVATGINNAGQIVGLYQSAAMFVGEQGYMFDGSSFTDLGGVIPSGINNSGQIVGSTTIINVPVPGASLEYAEGLNDLGSIVGVYALNGVEHAFVDSAGSYTLLDVPGSLYTAAYDINNDGLIVGTWIGSNMMHQGFVWENGAFETVDFPNAVETEILGVNNLGDLVGLYRYADGVTHGFVASDPTSVPEPSSGVLLVTAIGVLLTLRAKKRRLIPPDIAASLRAMCVQPFNVLRVQFNDTSSNVSNKGNFYRLNLARRHDNVLRRTA